jgi:hypothetical protein
MTFDVKGFTSGMNSVTIGRGPNGKWTYGLNLMGRNTGHSFGLSVYDTPYPSRRDCLRAALEQFIQWHEEKAESKTRPAVTAAKEALDTLMGWKQTQLSMLDLL